MKKFPLVSALVLVLALFSACFGGSADRAESLKLYANDGDVAPELRVEAELLVEPDYENKSLRVKYSKVFPNRTEATPELDVTTTGDVGEEYFGRFEELTEVVENYEQPEDLKDGDYLGSGVFRVVLTEESGEVFEIGAFENIEAADFQALQSFYLDLINLLTQEVPV